MFSSFSPLIYLSLPFQWFTRLLIRDLKLNGDVHAAFCQLVRYWICPLSGRGDIDFRNETAQEDEVP